MHWLWVIPAAVALVGMAVAAGLARRATEELQGLRVDAARMSDVHAGVREIAELAAAARDKARRLPIHRS